MSYTEKDRVEDWRKSFLGNDVNELDPESANWICDLAIKGLSAPKAVDVDGIIKDATFAYGQLAGAIEGDKKNRFPDGMLLHTSRVKRIIAETANSVYEIELRPFEFPMPTAQEWLPISEAPKDGSRYLCFWPTLGIVETYWTDTSKDGWGGQCWKSPYVPYDSETPEYKAGPTHFMPLPQPPKGV